MYHTFYSYRSIQYFKRRPSDAFEDGSGEDRKRECEELEPGWGKSKAAGVGYSLADGAIPSEHHPPGRAETRAEIKYMYASRILWRRPSTKEDPVGKSDNRGWPAIGPSRASGRTSSLAGLKQWPTFGQTRHLGRGKAIASSAVRPTWSPRNHRHGHPSVARR